MEDIQCEEMCTNKLNASSTYFQNPSRKKNIFVYVFSLPCACNLIQDNTRRAKIEAKSHPWKKLANLRDKTVPSFKKHEDLSHFSWMCSFHWQAVHVKIPIVEKSKLPSALKYLHSA